MQHMQQVQLATALLQQPVQQPQRVHGVHPPQPVHAPPQPPRPPDQQLAYLTSAHGQPMMVRMVAPTEQAPPMVPAPVQMATASMGAPAMGPPPMAAATTPHGRLARSTTPSLWEVAGPSSSEAPDPLPPYGTAHAYGFEAAEPAVADSAQGPGLQGPGLQGPGLYRRAEDGDHLRDDAWRLPSKGQVRTCTMHACMHAWHALARRRVAVALRGAGNPNPYPPPSSHPHPRPSPPSP